MLKNILHPSKLFVNS